MKLNKANFAGLTSPEQKSEMKAILAGTWPPLKPLPVFKYETAEYRATLDFDRKRGEWVCRKTSLPSNEVQELRGGLRAITMTLPHGESETFSEEAEQQEPELEKDTNRRFQAIHEWREKYENGARYFELRDCLSEIQRTELDDSLRLTLTARQLQFNARNAANVFDDLSVAGGRFAALIELATRSKAGHGAAPQAQDEEPIPEAEPAADDKQVLGLSSRELEPTLINPAPIISRVPDNTDPRDPDQEAAEQRTDADDFPAVSIKNVFPEQDQPSLPERIAQTAFQQLEIEDSEIVDPDSASLVEPLHEEEEHRTPAFAAFAAQVRGGQSFTEPIGASSWRFPRLEISAFQVNVFAILLLFAATAFTVGLTVGRGPVGKRLREAPKSLLATDAKPQAPPDQDDESSSKTLSPLAASSQDSAGAEKLDDATPSGDNSKEIPAGVGSAEARSPDSDSPSGSSPTTESKPKVSAEPEVSPERSGAIGPVPRNVLPRASSRLVRRPKGISKAVRSIRSAPRTPAPFRLASAIGSAQRFPGPSAALVTVPDHGSQPFRVSFPNKTIAATSSLAMTSQLSVLVSSEPGASVVHKPARLEAGELVSFVWPRYSEPRGRYGLAETIRVRATIGQLGQVQDVKFLGGSPSLLPPTSEAIRHWRFAPTLLDKRPVQAQQDVTIEFRPPQYSARLSAQHPSHN